MPIPTQGSSTQVPTSTTSVTPSPTPTEDPKVAERRALIERYFRAYNAALRSLDTTDLRDLFNKSCARCLGSAEKIDAVARDHGSLKGGGIVVDDIKIASESPLILQGRVQERAITVKSSSGSKDYPGTAPSYVLFKFTGKGTDLKISEIAG